MKKRPTTYVLLIERYDDEPHVMLHTNLDKVEEALRKAAADIWVSPSDEDLLELFAGIGRRVRVFACTMKRNVQEGTEIVPFARKAASSGDQLSLSEI
jgi:hypothetical protein